MKIKSLTLDRFMLFEHFESDWSPNINIICGNNNTGKTALLKILYSTVRAHHDTYTAKTDPTKDAHNLALVSKLRGVFRPDEENIGRLCSRTRGSSGAARVSVAFDSCDESEFSFGARSKSHVDFDKLPTRTIADTLSVYVPPKEIISATENFVSLYDDYHIAFEETYYDLARLLERPLKKGPNTPEQNDVLSSFESILDGNISYENKKFYLKVKGGIFEMGLVSEGYRKLSTIIHLILNGSLTKNTILFWDEPETNLNPTMTEPVCRAIVELAKMGVQVFVTTHDYFVQQNFNMLANYPKANPEGLKIQFTSLYRDDKQMGYETADEASELKHNPIMEEFDALYDREQRWLYDVD